MTVLILNASVTGVNLDTWSDTQWALALLVVLAGAALAVGPLLDSLQRHLDYWRIFRAQARRLK